MTDIECFFLYALISCLVAHAVWLHRKDRIREKEREALWQAELSYFNMKERKLRELGK